MVAGIVLGQFFPSAAKYFYFLSALVPRLRMLDRASSNQPTSLLTEGGLS